MKSLKQIRKISQFLCLLLRHKPEACNLDMNTEGWVSVKQLLKNIAVNEKNKLTLDELKLMVSDDTKGRYSFKGHGMMIRCNQGHSLDWVKIKFPTYFPKGDLYHGTAPHLEGAIMKDGLQSQGRNHVHLSETLETAREVGKRHSKKDEPIIFVIDKDADMTFFISENNVILADEVLPEYISILR